MMQPSHQDPSLRSARAIIKEAEHNIVWQPGERGRGFVTPTGEVHAWPEEWASHREWAANQGIPFNDISATSFITRQDGTSFFPYTRNNFRMQEQLGQEIQQADPRLNWMRYDDGRGPAQTYASVDPESLWDTSVS